MKYNNPNDIIDTFEEQEKSPNKKHKKKSRTKKSDHKHIYNKILIVESQPDYLKHFKNSIIIVLRGDRFEKE